jgi:hypothetical protein
MIACENVNAEYAQADSLHRTAALAAEKKRPRLQGRFT